MWHEYRYGQTNCYVGPSLEYGAFQINDSEIFICTERSALNLAYQGFSKQHGKTCKIATFQGEELVGLPVKAPLAKYDKVFVLPMESVLATKVIMKYFLIFNTREPVLSHLFLAILPMIMLL